MTDLNAMVAEEYRTGERVTTDADSIGLPLGWLALLLGFIVFTFNLILAIVLDWKRRRSPIQASQRAVNER
jgi:hypothetical protein